MSLVRLRNVGLIGLSQMVGMLGTLGIIKIWSVHLTPIELGKLSLVITTVSLFVSLLVLPLVKSMGIHIAAYRANGSLFKLLRSLASALLQRSILWSLIIAAFFFIGAGYFGLARATIVFAWALFVVITLSSCLLEYLTGLKRSQAFAIYYVADILVRFAFTWVALSYLNSGISGAVLAYACANFTVFLVAVLASSELRADIISISSSESDDAARASVVSSSGMFFSVQMLQNITENSSRYIIAWLAGAEAAGVFYIAFYLLRRPFGIVESIARVVLFAPLSSAINEAKQDEALKIKTLWLSGVIAVCSVGAFIFHLFGETFVLILTDRAYLEILNFTPILSVGLILFSAGLVFREFMAISFHKKKMLISAAAGAIVTIFATALLSYELGVAGAAFGLLVGSLAQCLVALFLMKRSGCSRLSPPI